MCTPEYACITHVKASTLQKPEAGLMQRGTESSTPLSSWEPGTTLSVLPRLPRASASTSRMTNSEDLVREGLGPGLEAAPCILLTVNVIPSLAGHITARRLGDHLAGCPGREDTVLWAAIVLSHRGHLSLWARGGHTVGVFLVSTASYPTSSYTEVLGHRT